MSMSSQIKASVPVCLSLERGGVKAAYHALEDLQQYFLQLDDVGVWVKPAQSLDLTKAVYLLHAEETTIITTATLSTIIQSYFSYFCFIFLQA